MATTPKAPTAPAAPKVTGAPAAAPVARTDVKADKKPKKDKKAKKEKVEKIEFRFDTNIFAKPEGAQDWNGGPKLASAEVPSTYDAAKHKPLRRSDFTNEYDFYEHKAKMHETEAQACRKLAEEARTVGAVGDKKKGKKVVALTNQLTNLLKELSGDGQTDINSLGLPPELLAAFTKSQGDKPADTPAAS